MLMTPPLNLCLGYVYGAHAAGSAMACLVCGRAAEQVGRRLQQGGDAAVYVVREALQVRETAHRTAPHRTTDDDAQHQYAQG